MSPELQKLGRVNPAIEFPELRITESYVKNCPVGEMPFLMQPLDNNQVAVFCFSNSNPFPPRSKFNHFLPSIADKCVGRGKRIALIRLFGWADNVSGSKVPNFRPDYFPKGHLLKHEDVLARLKTDPHTLYCGDDCAVARSHAVLWKAAFKPGLDDRSDEIIVGESPTRWEGEWVDVNGGKGDGQHVFREYVSKQYKVLLRERERDEFGVKIGCLVTLDSGEQVNDPWHDPVQRVGDPRGFANRQETAQGKVDLFQIYAQDDSKEHPLAFPMCWRPALVESSITKDMQALAGVAENLACNWDAPIDAHNRPHLLISDKCENLISCIVNWDGTSLSASREGGEARIPNPFKDFVDTFRYICDGNTPFLDQTRSQVSGGGGIGAF